jgi:protein-tyrosine phosphatase
MIDFHSHVLPGIDDGAKDVETSVAMLEESKRQGVTTIVCTPHYSGRKHSPARFKEKRNAAYERLKPHIPEGIDLRLGAEVFFPNLDLDPNFICVDEGTPLEDNGHTIRFATYKNRQVKPL